MDELCRRGLSDDLYEARVISSLVGYIQQVSLKELPNTYILIGYPNFGFLILRSRFESKLMFGFLSVDFQIIHYNNLSESK